MSSETSLLDNSLELVIKKVALQRRIDLSQYNANFVKRRLNVRLRAKGLQNYLQYSSLLDQDQTECDALFQSLSINVTEFFRNKDVFDAFYNQILPKLLHHNKQEEIRIWSAGCATGEETYTIAMLLDQASANYGQFKFKIMATDVSSKAVETAKKGAYLSSSLKNVPEEFLAKYFHQTSDGNYQLDKKIISLVNFTLGNILTMITPKSLDVIFCRNIIIYFDRKTQEQLFAKFAFSLKPHGYLILGKTEMIKDGASSLFEAEMPRERVYRKRIRTM